MHQRKFQRVGWLAESVTSCHEIWATDSEQMLRRQLRNVEPGPIAVAMANGDVDVFASKIDMVHSCGDSEINPRVSFGKPRKPMHEPLGCKIRRCADGKDA